jgi:hypothetical protein
MNFFTQNILRTIYLKPNDQNDNDFVQALKVPKDTYWIAANMLLANPDIP